MSYYGALITKWGTLSGSTSEKLAALNAATVKGADRLVPIAEVMSYLRSNGLWLPIKAAAASNIAAAACVDLAEDLRASAIDFNLALVQQVLTALGQSGLLSQAQADFLVGLKQTNLPWWEANSYPGKFNENDLIAAGGLK